MELVLVEVISEEEEQFEELCVFNSPEIFAIG